MPMHNPAHPGRVLKDVLKGHTVGEIADHIGVSRNSLSRVLNEKAAVSAEMSIRLSAALGTSPDMWFKMQNAYDFWHASRARRKAIPSLDKVA